MKLKHVVLIGVVSSIMSYLNNNLEVYGEDSDRQEQLLEDIRNLVNDKLEKFDVDGCLDGLKNDVPEHIEKARAVASDITESLIQELNGIIASFTSIKNEVMDEQDTEQDNEEATETIEEIVETPLEETIEEESLEEELDIEEPEVSVLEVPNDAFEDLIKTIEIKEEDEEDEDEEEEEELPANDDDEIRNSLIAELEQLVREIDLETSTVSPIEETIEEDEEIVEEPVVEEFEEEVVEEIDEKENIIADLEKFLAFNLNNLTEEVIEEEEEDEEETEEVECCGNCDECEDCEEIFEEITDVIDEDAIEDELEVEECGCCGNCSQCEENLEEITDEMLESFSEDDYLSAIQDAINSSIIFGEDGNTLELGDIFDEAIEDDDDAREISKDEIDEIFADILNQEKPVEEDEEIVEETVLEEPVVEEEVREEFEEEVVEKTTTPEDEYLDNLIDQLNDALSDDEEETVEEEELEEEVVETPDLYTQINQLYPYLSRGFVRAVYDLKEAIARDYPIDRGIIILHRISFDDLDSLRQFAEIVLSHDYRVNVDERQMIVDILKECKNTDGKILTNIFEIANQASLLDGVYEGYRVEIVE